MKDDLNSKKVLLVFILMLGLTFIAFGLSYAFFNYQKDGEKIVSLTSGSVKLHYEESSLNKINLTNALPMDETRGKQTDYFEFTITGETAGYDVSYYVASRVTSIDANRIPANYISLYLTEVVSGVEQQVLLTTYDQLTYLSKNNHVEQQLLNNTIQANTSNYEKVYRLRMWVNEDADYSPTESNGVQTYPMQDKEFYFIVNVYTEAEEYQQQNTLPPGLYTLDDQLIEDWDSLVARGMNGVNMNGATWTYINAALEDHNEETGKLVCADTLRTVGSSAFNNSSSKLNTIILNEGVTSIGSGAFMDSPIKHVTFPTTLTTIEASAFNGSKLEEADIYGTNLVIGANAFNSCSQLTSVHLRSGVKTVGQNGFAHSNNVSELIIDNGVEEFKDLAFYLCSIENDLVIPASVTKIGYLSFANNEFTNLQVLADDVEIGGQAFGDNPNLTTAYIKNATTDYQILRANPNLETYRQDGGTLGDTAFSGDTKLTSVTLSNVTTIGGTLIGSSTCNISSVVLPNTIEKINSRAFWGCKLTEVTIPSGSIESSAFDSNTALTTVNIGTGVTKIDSRAFASSSNLTTVNFASNNNLLNIEGDSFSYTPWYNTQYNTNGYVVANKTLLKLNSGTAIPNNVEALVASIFNVSGIETVKIPAQIRMIINDNYGEYPSSITSFVFENTNNWYRYYPYVEEGESNYIAMDVSNPTQNAYNFTNDLGYIDSYFFERRDN